MTEYKGFKYEKIASGWRIVLPSGLSRKVPEQTEEELKAGIDALSTGN